MKRITRCAVTGEGSTLQVTLELKSGCQGVSHATAEQKSVLGMGAAIMKTQRQKT